MYGLVNDAVKALVLEKFGRDTWNTILEKAGQKGGGNWILHDTFSDADTVAIVIAAAELLGVGADDVLHIFGTYFLKYLKDTNNDHMLFILGNNLQDFMFNLDYLHAHLQTVFHLANFPHFKCCFVNLQVPPTCDSPENAGDNGLSGSQQTTRPALELSYVSSRGSLLAPFVKGLVETIAAEMYQSPVNIDMTKTENGARLIITETKTDTRKRSQLFAKRWIRRVSVDVKEPLLEGSVSDYGFDTAFFSRQWPWFILFDDNLELMLVGESLHRVMPHLKKGDKLFNHFSIERPLLSEVNLESILEHSNVAFSLVSQKIVGSASSLKLRGAIEKMDLGGSNRCAIMYLCSPRILGVEDMIESGANLTDVPLHDATRELLLLSEHRTAEAKLLLKLERLSAELADEQRRSDDLLLAMLPKHVVADLRDGKKVQGTHHPEVSILFSDIVGFTEISSTCRPSQVCDMLDELYTVYDTISAFFGVYKVETIGDAYMVAGGLFGTPEELENHAVEVAMQAFAMQAGAQLVISPIGNGPINVRVGIHSGAVLSGVVGLKMPRYCLFGDTVNMASRMESTGEKLKIHCSEATAKLLKRAGFKVETRGVTQVKGKGEATTYWVVDQPEEGKKRTAQAVESAQKALLDLIKVREDDEDYDALERDAGISSLPRISSLTSLKKHKGLKPRSNLMRRRNKLSNGMMGSTPSDSLSRRSSSDSLASWAESHSSMLSKTGSAAAGCSSPLALRQLHLPDTSRQHSVDSNTHSRASDIDAAGSKSAMQDGATEQSDGAAYVEEFVRVVQAINPDGELKCPFGFDKLAAVADACVASQEASMTESLTTLKEIDDENTKASVSRVSERYSHNSLAKRLEDIEKVCEELTARNQMLEQENEALRAHAGCVVM